MVEKTSISSKYLMLTNCVSTIHRLDTDSMRSHQWDKLVRCGTCKRSAWLLVSCPRLCLRDVKKVIRNDRSGELWTKMQGPSRQEGCLSWRGGLCWSSQSFLSLHLVTRNTACKQRPSAYCADESKQLGWGIGITDYCTVKFSNRPF